MLPAKVTASACFPASQEPACNAGDLGSIPGLGKSPGEGNGSPLQSSCLENPMDRGAWQGYSFTHSLKVTSSCRPPSTGSQFSICAQGVSAVGAGTGPTASRILTQRETGTLTQRSPTCPSPDGNPASSHLPPAEPTGLCAPDLPR